MAAIHKLEAQHHTVVFASARPIRDMLPLLKKDFENNFYIGGNGSIVKNDGKIESIAVIDSESMSFIKALIDQYDLDYLIDDEWYYALKNRNEALAQINSKVDALKLSQNVAIEKLKNPIKCILLNLPEGLFAQIATLLASFPVELVFHEGTSSIDITAKNINKLTTFKKFFTNQTYNAFGNDHNDVSLLKSSQKAHIIGNSLTLKHSDLTYLPANAEGIAAYLNEFSTK